MSNIDECYGTEVAIPSQANFSPQTLKQLPVSPMFHDFDDSEDTIDEIYLLGTGGKEMDAARAPPIVSNSQRERTYRSSVKIPIATIALLRPISLRRKNCIIHA